MKHKLTRLTSLLLALIMSFSMLLVPANAAFVDVPEKAWYADAVEYVQDQGWMKGVSANSFAPNAEVTRAMFVTVLARFADADDNDLANNFVDVPANSWYTKAVAWAAANEIVKGVSASAFAPNRAISRQEMCTMLYRFIKNVQKYDLNASNAKNFSDKASIAGYAQEAVDFCSAAGLVAGYTDGSFRPTATATRAQTATILMRLDLLLDGRPIDPIPMPEQSFDGQAGEDMTVKVNAPEGALPEKSTMTTKRVTDDASLMNIQSKVSGTVLAAADITFKKDDEEIEPETDVEVLISLAELPEDNNLRVVHVKHDGDVEYVNSELVSVTRRGNKALRFYAKDFSVYAVVGEGEASEFARMTVNFYAADDATEPVYSVHVTQQDAEMLGKIIADPQIPQTTGNAMFCGWSVGKNYTVADVDGRHDINFIRNEVKERLQSEVKEGDTFDVYAMIYNCFTLNFKDENNDTTLTSKVFYTKEDSITYNIDQNYTPYLSGYRFIGWEKEIGNDHNKYGYGQDVEINSSVTLIARVQQGYWLTFNERPDSEFKGATYNPPYFCEDGIVTSAAKPETPTLPGYTFGGWFKNYDKVTKKWTDEFNFTETITQDTTLYAKWELNQTVGYTVLIWQENAALNGYGLAETVTIRNGKPKTVSEAVKQVGTGDNAYVTVDGTAKQYTGFKLKEFDQNVTILPNGTTVINVYYERRTYTLTFKEGNKTVGTITEKYGTSLKGKFPLPGKNGYRWSPNTNNYFKNILVYIAYMPPISETFTYNSASRPTKTITWYVEALDTDTDTTTVSKTLYYDTDNKIANIPEGTKFKKYDYVDAKYNGVTIEEDFIDLLGFEKLGADDKCERRSGKYYYIYDENQNGSINFYYLRKKCNIVYQDGVYIDGNKNKITDESSLGLIKEETGIPYESNLAAYNKNGEKYYTPTRDGYLFEGWYATKECTGDPYTFTTMPEDGITLYAKWQQIEYRVFLKVDTVKGDTQFVPILPEGQDTNFRVDYGDAVSDGNVISVTAKDGLYELVGWFTDEACTKAYNFATKLNDSNTEAYDKESMPTESDGTNGDANRYWITKQLTLFAKWRKVLVGANGIQIKYDAVEPASDAAPTGRPGHFGVNETIWSDSSQAYADQASVIARSASTPDAPEDYIFDHWDILDKDGNDVGDVFPGQSFTADVKYAEEKTVTASQNGFEDGENVQKSENADNKKAAVISGPVKADSETIYFCGFEEDETEKVQQLNVYDLDGDEETWQWGSFEEEGTVNGTGAFVSRSYDPDNYKALSPDNLVVTPVISLPSSGNIKFSMFARGVSQYYYSENFTVYITTKTEITSLTDFSGENGDTIISDTKTVNDLREYTAEIDEKYLGKDVRFAIRHYNVSDQYYLVVDDISVTNEKSTYTVTFVDHDGTVLKTQEVDPGEDATAPENPVREGYEFTGWDTDFSNVTSDLTVKALYNRIGYYTVIFKDWDGRILSTQEVQKGNSAEEPTHPTRDKFVFSRWSVDFTNVQENLIVYAVYTREITKTLTMTLRAAYKPTVKQEKTHVTWYANNGTDVSKDSKEVFINQAFDIEDPDTFKAAEKNLENLGYSFLGWARLPELNEQKLTDSKYKDYSVVTYTETVNGKEVVKIKEYKGLNENDLWLVYHPAVGENKAYFTVNEAGVDETKTFSMIAPNENTPYHGLYAVWKRDVFYILHSSTGELQAVGMPVGTGVAPAGAQYKTGSVDLTEFVQPGYLYGGYYTDKSNDGFAYGYVKTEDVNNVAAAFTATSVAEHWTAVASTAAASEASVVGKTTMSANSVAFTPYHGDSLYTNGTNKPYMKDENGYVKDEDGKTIKKWPAVWNSNDAETVSGTSLEPKINNVYYLKEVPSQYLTSKVFYTYDTTQNNKIVDIWLLSLYDDGNYSKEAAGFYVNKSGSTVAATQANFVAKTSLSTTFTLIQNKSADGETDYQPVMVDATKFGLKGGAVLVTHLTELANSSVFTMLPTWTTPDGIEVKNNGLTFRPNDDKSDLNKLLTWNRYFDGTEKLYFNVDGDTAYWTNDSYAVFAFFFNKSTSGVEKVQLQKTASEKLYEITVPEGDWAAFKIGRCSQADYDAWVPNGNNWPGYVPNETNNITILTSKTNPSLSHVNYIVKWYDKSDLTEWKDYTVNPS